MRAEDKRLGIDRDEAGVEQIQRQDLAQRDERDLEQQDDQTSQQVETEQAKTERCAAMMGVLDKIFGGQFRPLVGVTGFSRAELEAFHFLQAAVTGRDLVTNRIVYAEDREDLLEQALAVLYPTLSHGMEQVAADLREHHDALVDRVVGLREHIANKDDSQEDPIELRQRLEEAAAADGDKDDDDKGDGEGDGSGAGDGEAGDGEAGAAGEAAARKPDDDDDDDDDRGDGGGGAADVGDGGMMP